MTRSRHSLSGSRPKSFSVRWHSIANPATPSADIMSSPDPLNETTVTELLPPSATARRAPHSQRSQRSQRLASAANSPRKQMFELQVGDTRSPQRLWVTVETEYGSGHAAAGVRRKLFQSPASTGRHARAVTTMTMPLRDSDDEAPSKDGLATPKTRRRSCKSNETPISSAAKGKGTPKRTRLANVAESEELRPEANVQPTPTSARKRRILEPLNGSGGDNVKRRKRARPVFAFKQSVGTDDAAFNGQPPLAPDTPAPGGEAPKPDAPEDDDQESDIWMATISNEETPRAPVSTASELPPPTHHPSDGWQPEAARLGSDQDSYPSGDDYHLMAAASDVSSVDEPAGASEPPVNDTIAQGEDFSVISMDSIPSLQRVLRSSIPPAAEEQLGEKTSLIISNTLESLRRGGALDVEADVPVPLRSAPLDHPPIERVEVEDELDSSEASAIRTSATRSPSRTRSPNHGPSRRLTHSPRKADNSSSLRHRVLKFAARQVGVSVSNGVDRIVDEDQATDPGSGRRLSYGRGDEAADAFYEDSFSEIPKEILTAAAPSHGETEDDDGGRHKPRNGDALQVEDAGEATTGTGYEGLPPRDSNASSACQSEPGRLPTPDDTPPEAEAFDVLKEAQLETESAKARRPISPVDVQAEPEATEWRLSRPSDPVRRVSAEAEEPSRLSAEATPARRVSSPLQEPQSLQHEAWQDKTTRPTLSAIVRAGRTLQSVTSDPPSSEEREKQLGSPFRSSGSRDSWNESRDSQGSRRTSKSPQWPLSALGSPARDDPFGPATQSTGQARFMEALGRRMATEEDQETKRSPSSSIRVTPQGEDAMSWIAREGPISPRLRDRTLQEAYGAASAPSQGGGGVSTSLRQHDGASIQGPQEETAERQDDETDIWELEAQRETRQTTGQPPLRKRAVMSSRTTEVRLKKAAPVNQEKRQRESEPEEYSLVVERRRLEQQQKGDAQGEVSASKARRFDLSAFFSSPASIPGMLASRLLRGRTAAVSRAVTRGMPTGSMFPPLPPGMGMLCARSGDLGQDAPSSTAAAEAARSSDADRTVSMASSLSPAERQDGGPDQQANPPRAPALRVAAATTPPRMQLSHADIHRWQQETSKAGDRPSPGFNRPHLRPLPPKNASPTKSSLRSPLKPRTPGRVVEFTSSVLSPAEQARVRQERRLWPGPCAAAAAEVEEEQQQQQAAPVTDAPRLRVADRRPSAAPARHAWTRRHWLLLDQLLQLRRGRPFARRYPPTADGLLGKTVRSQGEALRLERWHLDCVDAFCTEVAVADPGVLAKRLAALVLAEQRRGRSRAERPPDAMFH